MMADMTPERKRTLAMIRRCFRHQQPAAFGRRFIEPASLPPELLGGDDENIAPQGRLFREMEMGNGENE